MSLVSQIQAYILQQVRCTVGLLLASNGEEREEPSPRTLTLWAGKQVLLVKQQPGHHSPGPHRAQARDPTSKMGQGQGSADFRFFL